MKVFFYLCFQDLHSFVSISNIYPDTSSTVTEHIDSEYLRAILAAVSLVILCDRVAVLCKIAPLLCIPLKHLKKLSINFLAI